MKSIEEVQEARDQIKLFIIDATGTEPFVTRMLTVAKSALSVLEWVLEEGETGHRFGELIAGLKEVDKLYPPDKVAH